MKAMKWMNKNTVTLVAALLLAVSSGVADVVVYSVGTAVDTRTQSRIAAQEDKPVDSRSYTIDWSIAGTLNTKKIIGTILVIR
ncbi:MAG: hypothetical protein WC340_12815 [Kiritimatiellia bacterium]|jgi:hypothetical protein